MRLAELVQRAAVQHGDIRCECGTPARDGSLAVCAIGRLLEELEADPLKVYERLGLTVALERVRRGDPVEPNTAAVLALALDRLAGRS